MPEKKIEIPSIFGVKNFNKEYKPNRTKHERLNKSPPTIKTPNV